MGVITGTAKGCRLETLAGTDTRPTVERVKEGIFSAINFEIEGRRVLDLFAGSGQMGLEALSRGAASCVFVDSSRDAVQVVRRNMTATKLSANATVLCRDALGFLQQSTERRFRALADVGLIWCFWIPRMTHSCLSRAWKRWQVVSPPVGRCCVRVIAARSFPMRWAISCWTVPIATVVLSCGCIVASEG